MHCFHSKTISPDLSVVTVDSVHADEIYTLISVKLCLDLAAWHGNITEKWMNFLFFHSQKFKAERMFVYWNSRWIVVQKESATLAKWWVSGDNDFIISVLISVLFYAKEQHGKAERISHVAEKLNLEAYGWIWAPLYSARLKKRQYKNVKRFCKKSGLPLQTNILLLPVNSM